MDNQDTPTVSNSSSQLTVFNPTALEELINQAELEHFLTHHQAAWKEEQAPIPTPGNQPQRDFTLENYKSDVGYADELAKAYRDRIRFIPEEEIWLIFSPISGWHRDTSGEVLGLASDFAKNQLFETIEKVKKMNDHRAAGAYLASATRLGNMNRIAPALELAKVKRELVVSIADLDREPYLLGTRNGVVDLRNGFFSPHDSKVMVTRQVACNYDQTARCPRFLGFLEEVQPDPDMRGFLQRMCGYTLTGYMGENILPFHYGVGANGKGTFLEQTLLKLMGSYGAKVTDELVYTNSRGTAPHLEIAGLCGIRFALGEENEAGGNLNERLLKSITGGDRQKGRFHYKPFFEYTPTAKVHLVGNHKPRITGRDDGIWRRFRLVKWEVQIAPERQDHRFYEKLAPEFPGILNWMIAGALALGSEGTRPPEGVVAATLQFREDSDAFGDFLREHTVDDEHGHIAKADLYRLYRDYCEDQQTQPRFRLTKRFFGNRVVERGYTEARAHGGVHIWRGLRERTAADDRPAAAASPAVQP